MNEIKFPCPHCKRWLCSKLVFAIFFLTAVGASGATYYWGVFSSIPWPGGTIRYSYDASVTTNQRTAFEAAAGDWELAANVHFVPRTVENDYLIVKAFDDGTPFPYRSTGGPQSFFPLGWHRGQIQHEIGHVLGFTHEMACTNRDTYVTIHTNNLLPSEQWMAFYDPNSAHIGAYDFDSVMTGTGGTLLFRGGVIVPTGKADPKTQYQPALIGHNYGDLLSKGDRAGLALLYGSGPPLSAVVTTTKDGGVGSLRAAVYYANDHPGTIVSFNIPTNDPGYDVSSGTFLVRVIDHLPALKAIGTIIDGSTQPGFASTPRIVVDGSWNNTAQLGYEVYGFKILAANCRLKSLTINGFSGMGVWILGPLVTNVMVQCCYIGTDAVGNVARGNGDGVTIEQGSKSNLIGGILPGEGNVISGNTSTGLRIMDVGTMGNLVLGNLIGTTKSGNAALPNGYAGVQISDGASDNTIGGTVGGARNTISGNTAYGVVMFGSETSRNVVEGNFIGTDTNGTTAVGNWAGVGFYSGVHDNMIGGVASNARNVISGNSAYGMIVADSSTCSNRIQGNFVGTRKDGTNALGNGFNGIFLYDDAHHNVLGLTVDDAGAGNTIAFSASDGVRLDGTNSIGNTIRGNSVFSNGGLGIELGGPAFFGVTANDSCDADTGPNRLQNYPVLTTAAALATTTTISGTLNSTPGHAFIVDLYRSANADPSVYGEGQIYVGSTNLNTGGNCSGSFTAVINGNFSGQFFTGTATDIATGDTSEFSRAILATNAPFSPQFVGPYVRNSNGFTFSLYLQTNRTYRLQGTTNLGTNPQWLDLTNFTATISPIQFTDRSATNYSARFYRVLSP